MSFAQLSKVRLEYFSHGQGPERILFIHGFQASARIWEKVQRALPAERYTSVAINNRGAGQSDAPPDESAYGVPVFAEDAFQLAAQLGWTRFTLVGHSLGGATAAQFALEHPDVLKGLVLLDPASPTALARVTPFWADVYRAGRARWVVEAGQYTMTPDQRPLIVLD